MVSQSACREVSGAVGPPSVAGFVAFLLTMFCLLPHPSLSKLKALCSFQTFLRLLSLPEGPSSHPPQELVTHKRNGDMLAERMEEG